MTAFKRLLLFDSREWRARAYEASIRPFAEMEGLSTCIVTEVDEIGNGNKDDLCLIICGSHPLSSEPVLRKLELLQGKFRGGIAIVADNITGKCIDVALGFGLRAVVNTGMPVDVVNAALRFIVAGGYYIPHAETLELATPESASYLPRPDLGASEFRDSQSNCLDELTRRQREVALALASGLSNKEIARDLSLSEATVKSHVRQIMQTFSVTNRTKAALAVHAAVAKS